MFKSNKRKKDIESYSLEKLQTRQKIKYFKQNSDI